MAPNETDDQTLDPSSDFPIPLAEVFNALAPGAEFTLYGNTYDGTDWTDPRPMPHWEDCVDYYEKLKAGKWGARWEDLALRLSGLIGFAMRTENTNAFTLLNLALTEYRNPEMLETALQGVRDGMPKDSELFEPTVKFVNKALADNNFEFEI